MSIKKEFLKTLNLKEEDNFRRENLEQAIGEETKQLPSGKWVNDGGEGPHGKFATKAGADAQRKAMFANGYQAEGLIGDVNINKDQL